MPGRTTLTNPVLKWVPIHSSLSSLIESFRKAHRDQDQHHSLHCSYDRALAGVPLQPALVEQSRHFESAEHSAALDDHRVKVFHRAAQAIAMVDRIVPSLAHTDFHHSQAKVDQTDRAEESRLHSCYRRPLRLVGAFSCADSDPLRFVLNWLATFAQKQLLLRCDS